MILCIMPPFLILKNYFMASMEELKVGKKIIVDGQPQQLVNSVITDRYWRFTFPDTARGQFPAGGYILQITAAGATSGSERGLWFISLTDADSE